MEARDQVVMVTEASSGIGNSCAAFLAKKGFRVIGTCSTPGTYSKKADEFFDLLPMDSCDTSSVQKAVDSIMAKHGRIDALIVFAPEAPDLNVSKATIQQIRECFEKSVVGAIIIIKTMLTQMEVLGFGKIIVQVDRSTNASRTFFGKFPEVIVSVVQSLAFDYSGLEISFSLLEGSSNVRAGIDTSRTVFRSLLLKRAPYRIFVNSIESHLRNFVREYLPSLWKKIKFLKNHFSSRKGK